MKNPKKNASMLPFSKQMNVLKSTTSKHTIYKLETGYYTIQVSRRSKKLAYN